jgi:hypothetical protein
MRISNGRIFRLFRLSERDRIRLAKGIVPESLRNGLAISVLLRRLPRRRRPAALRRSARAAPQTCNKRGIAEFHARATTNRYIPSSAGEPVQRLKPESAHLASHCIPCWLILLGSPAVAGERTSSITRRKSILCSYCPVVE